MSGNWGSPITLPLPQVDDAQEIWHYTDVHGLFGIIDSSALRAAAANALNDVSELKYGFGVLSAALERMGGDKDIQLAEAVRASALGATVVDYGRDDTFMISASTDGDSLNQWMHYASGSGYALRFTAKPWIGEPSFADWAYRAQQGKPFQPYMGGDLMLPGWRRVIYSYEESVSVAVELIRTLQFVVSSSPESFQVLGSLALQAASLFKPEAFADEREVRCAFRNESNRKFGVSRERLRSFIEVTGPEGRLPLAEVRCGPGADDRTFSSVVGFLKAHRYDVPVSRSEIPYSSR